MIFTFSQGLSHSTNTSSMNVSFAISNARYIFTGTFTSALVERRKWIIDSFMAIAGQYGCQLNFFFYRYLYVKKFVSLYCNITVELGPPWYYMIGYTSSFVCYYAFFIVGTVCVCAFVKPSGATPAWYISTNCITRSDTVLCVKCTHKRICVTLLSFK